MKNTENMGLQISSL